MTGQLTCCLRGVQASCYLADVDLLYSLMMPMRQCCRMKRTVLLTVCLLGLLCQGGAVEAQFAPHGWPQDTGAPVNSSPVIGDIDNDGIQEIVVGSDNNMVYAWKPDGTLMPGWPVTTGDSVRSSPALADLNGDGHLDIVVGSFDNKVYAWNFNGTLLPGWPAVTGSVIYSSPAVGDIDGDQLPEVVIGSFDNKVYAWNADGTVVRGWPKPTGLFVYSSPALADLDQDGIVEVIVGTDNHRVFAWKGDGTAIEGWPAATEHVVPSSPAVGDLDNDGELEVIVGSWDKVFVWNRYGERKSGWPVIAGHQIPSSPALGDLTNDGRLEVVIGCKDGKVYAWDANGQLVTGWPTVTDAEIVGSPVLGDLNGDGVLEVVIGSKDSKVYAWGADGRLLPGWPKSTGGEISATPALGDTDGNGTLEVFVGSKDNRMHAWTIERKGSTAPQIAWQSFRGNSHHSGYYGEIGRKMAVAASSSDAPSISVISSGPGRMGIQTPSGPTVIKAGPRAFDNQGLKSNVEGYVADLVVMEYDDNSLTLSWTAPLGAYTPEARYDIRFAAEAITEENWDTAFPYHTALQLAAAGKRETHQLEHVPLAVDKPVFVAMKIMDKVAGSLVPVGPLSSVAKLIPVDNTPPAQIQSLKVAELNATTLELSWIASGGDGGQGTAAQYDLRFAPEAITEENWMRATQVENLPAPLPAGMLQKIQVPKPWDDREIFWGLKVVDDSLNISQMSNEAVWRPHTLVSVPQSIDAPTISDLHLESLGRDWAKLGWTAQGDANGQQAASYELRYAGNLREIREWRTAVSAENLPIPSKAGTQESFTLTGLRQNTPYFVGLRLVDAEGNVSETSNILRIETVETLPPTAVSDLAIEELRADGVTLNWSAPEQDSMGVAGYDIRYALRPISEESWDTASRLPTAPLPGRPQHLETFTVTEGPKDSAYYLALKSYDAQGNSSALSNVIQIPKVDTVPPGPILDLFAKNVETDSITIAWTATGDDGGRGQAAAQIIRIAPSLTQIKQWDLAQDVANSLQPSTAGTKESFVIRDLKSDSSYYVAVKSVDAFGNESEMSNIIRAKTRDNLAPVSIADLKTRSVEADSVVLEWTAPGEDGMEGQATSYTLRYSQTSITPASWPDARSVPLLPDPEPAGTRQRVRVTGLSPNTRYYFAMTAVDADGNTSPLSNQLEVSTSDTVAPGMITTLTAEQMDGTSVRLSWISPGDDDLHGIPAGYDVRYSDRPLTEARWSEARVATGIPQPSPQGDEEHLLLSGLRVNTLYYIAVRTFDVEGNVSPVSNIVRVYTSENVITDLEIADFSEDEVVLSWTTPGGVFLQDRLPYDIRYSSSKITEDTWDKARSARPHVLDDLSVKEPGSPERIRVRGLPPYEQIFWAVKLGSDAGMDESSQTSALSNVVELRRPDTMPPADVADLVARDGGEAAGGLRNIELSWTAPGDNDFEGSATRYDIRYGYEPVTEENWNAMTVARPVPKPLSAGTYQKTVVQVPSSEETVYFALQSIDEQLNMSPLSNSAQWSPEDTSAPSAIVDLKAERQANGDVKLSWTAPGDNADRGTAAFYDIRFAEKEKHVKQWKKATLIQGEPLPDAAGTAQEYTITGLRKDRSYYVAMITIDDAKNLSGLSNIALIGKVLPQHINDLTFVTGTETSVTLSWTAPKDRMADRVVKYEIRYAESPEGLKKWTTAERVKHKLVPKTFGEMESITVETLSPNMCYYFGIKVLDSSKERSPLSNVAIAYTTDTIAPQAIDDLTVAQADKQSLTVSWTVIADDAKHETPASYALRYSLGPLGEDNWDSASLGVDDLQPGPPGSLMEYTISGLEENTPYYVAVRAIDEAGNLSPLSSPLEARTQDLTSPAAVADLRAFYPTSSSVMLRWTASADAAGPVTRASLEDLSVAAYDIRYFPLPPDGEIMQQFPWERAQKVALPPVPNAPGQVEEFVVAHLLPDQTYSFALRSIDRSGNVSEISNFVLETTFPAEERTAQSRAISPSERSRWKLVQGKGSGRISGGVDAAISLQKSSNVKGRVNAAAMTAVYPAGKTLPQAALRFDVKGTEPFTFCARVTAAERGEPYYLCYTTEEPLTNAQHGASRIIEVLNAPEEAAALSLAGTPWKRIENYVFYPLDAALLDGGWHEMKRDLLLDLLDATGHTYLGADRFVVRSESVSLRKVTLKGQVFTPITDFEDRVPPLQNGWKLHFGSGSVRLAEESFASDVRQVGSSRRDELFDGVVIAGIRPRSTDVNTFLSAESSNASDIVITYPKSAIGQLSSQPFFMAMVKAGPEFKLIVKVQAGDGKEYYVAYLPETPGEAASEGLSGNYIYMPLQSRIWRDGWTLVQADLAGDLRRYQLDYAHTSWLSFHGKSIGIDNIGFSTEVLEEILQ
ncbi:hypothetical protein CSB45_02110 [candidate division KSB3 bacterium]|uniref:Fibronectin type-III domain-containing protein n=1 Tax=candidate division KSB3 bacterium TaxID=2044937 RepID=A0A2G6E9R5_9BACT|nr:MAG: hypothetical protein CSB45_02110 [candidate division KSB3 bacterium]PIE30876.1 MAG: hypothetical protein CSA57_00720 [candidate division KSB3 bacterium]